MVEKVFFKDFIKSLKQKEENMKKKIKMKDKEKNLMRKVKVFKILNLC